MTRNKKNIGAAAVALFALTWLPVAAFAAPDDNPVSSGGKRQHAACAEADEKTNVNGSVSCRVEQSFEPSYITFGGGYDSTGNIHGGDLWYEAQLYLHLNWFNYGCQKEDRVKHRGPWSCNGDNVYRVYFPIRLQVRQFREESEPVRTPSYNPGIRVYYWHKSWIKDEGRFTYLSAGFHHYSNGQSGPPTVNGIANTKDGSFSSDYAEFSVYRQQGDPDGRQTSWWFKMNARKYFPGMTWEHEQTGYYETGLLELSARAQRRGIRLQLTEGYKFHRTYVVPGENAHFEDNLQHTLELTVPVHTRWQLLDWYDLALYLRWDRGFDYYNINYQKRMSRIQFGVVAGTF